jgi:hypothetical protein
MHLIPKNQEDWRNFLPALCKGYVVLAYAIWKAISIYISGDNSPFTPPVAITVGYVFSIVILSFVAGKQVGQKQTRAAVRTFIFITIGGAFWLMNFPGSLAFGEVTFCGGLLVNGFIICYGLNARRFQKTRALTFWIWGSAINIVREIGLVICNYWTPPLGNAGYVGRTDFWGLMYYFPMSSFLEFYWLGFLLAGVLYVAGIVLSLQKLQSEKEFIPSPNTAMFVALGFLASMILMAISFMRLQHVELLPTLVINLATFYFCYIGYRQFKTKSFIFLALAAMLTILKIIGLDCLDWYHNSIHNGGIYTFEQWLIELMLMGSVLAIVFLGTGIFFLVRQLRENKT